MEEKKTVEVKKSSEASGYKFSTSLSAVLFLICFWKLTNTKDNTAFYWLIFSFILYVATLTFYSRYRESEGKEGISPIDIIGYTVLSSFVFCLVYAVFYFLFWKS